MHKNTACVMIQKKKRYVDRIPRLVREKGFLYNQSYRLDALAEWVDGSHRHRYYRDKQEKLADPK